MLRDVSRVLHVTCFLWLVSSVGHGRRRTRQAPGPNMCSVQQVYGTGEKFYTRCVARHLRMICERPTYVRWDCCSGYEREPGRQGCTKEKPLENLLETARTLGLSEFVRHVEVNNLTDLLTSQGAFTVFAPSDQAFRDASAFARTHVQPKDGSDSLLLYHVAPGKLPLSTFRSRNQQFVTLYQGNKIRVNKYAYGVATVNCARIIRPDEKATNGVIHVIDKVVKPLQVEGNLAEKIFADSRYSQFQMALFVSEMVNLLRQQGSGYTVLAPTNQAFSQLPSDLLDRILTDATTAEKVIRHHVVKGVYCGDAIVVSVGLKTLDEGRVLFRCTRGGLKANGARVVDQDHVATNGILHGIDKVLLPDAVKEPTDLMEEMLVKKLLEMARKAGLEHKLNNVTNVTIFAPTDDAFARLPSRTRAALRKDPLEVGRMLDFHIVKGQLTEDQVIGSLELNTSLSPSINPATIKVNVFRDGVAVDTAETMGPLRQCGKAAVQKVSKVLVPPEHTLMTLIEQDRGLSIFRQAVESAGLSELLNEWGRYTVLAPTNRAFSHLDQHRLDRLLNDPERLKKFVSRHIINRMVPRCEVPDKGTYSVKSRQGDLTVFNYDTRGNLLVNDLIAVRQWDRLATNGVLHRVDDVLKCSCERSLTSSRRYRYRSRNRRYYTRLRY
ncbi:transforming growth factor-beta-induced protein ig-h3-like [Babylonia areolata]|uniref:transforming growth factor-beta-induced protein ig-h3-like n=1 Tax=Babylonia areolata TaxID=304850 RepID=UPI003FD37911